jgi:hypothetical protein
MREADRGTNTRRDHVEPGRAVFLGGRASRRFLRGETPVRKQLVDGVYRLDEGALLDDFFYFLDQLGVMRMLSGVHGTAWESSSKMSRPISASTSRSCPSMDSQHGANWYVGTSRNSLTPNC